MIFQSVVVGLALLVAAVTACCANAGAQERAIRADFSGDRIVVLARGGVHAQALRWWADTDGIGYVTKRRAAQLGARVASYRLASGRTIAIAIVPFHGGFPPPSTLGGGIPLVGDDAAPDPLHAGLDGQLGYSWFAGRRWVVDYRHHRLSLVASLQAPAAARAIRLRVSNAVLPSPRVTAAVSGDDYEMTIDLGAAVRFSDAALRRIGGYAGVQGTSFATRRLVSHWHAAHPAWAFLAEAGATRGISAVRVPRVRVGAVELRDVWFTTRPDDDVFGGDRVVGKLGGSAFRNRMLLLDYVARTAYVVPAS